MRKDDSLTDASRFVALILRHKPSAIGITLDAHGWARVDELVAGVAKTRPFTKEMLVRIVEEDEKKRYAVAGVLTGYFLQLNDMLEDYYDFLDVEEEDRPI